MVFVFGIREEEVGEHVRWKVMVDHDDECEGVGEGLAPDPVGSDGKLCFEVGEEECSGLVVVGASNVANG